VRFLQHGDRISIARILTSDGTHGFLLTTEVGEVVAIKTGFASGYPGEGPRRFSYVLQLLDAHNVEIHEYEVSQSLMNRLDSSSLTESDIRKIEQTHFVRGRHWREYVLPQHGDCSADRSPWAEFPLVMPFAIVDPRLTDLAISFWDNPDDCLLKAFRRLEDIVRKRTGINAHGSKLFSQAFLGVSAKLHWPDKDSGEQTSRAQMFVSAFGAFRNPRAHREVSEAAADQLVEFLAVNQLFRLERTAVTETAG